MTLLEEAIDRCDVEIRNSQINIRIEDAKKQLWYEFKGILEQVKEGDVTKP